jgi:hypothetical protein
MKKDGVKPTEAAAAFGLSPRLVSRWRKVLQVEREDKHFVSSSKNHRDPESFLDNIAQDLVSFVSLWRDCGMPVSRLAVISKAGQLKPAFKEKTLSARQMCVSRFLLKNNLVHRVVTHTAQRLPEQVTVDTQVRWTYLRSTVHVQHGPDCHTRSWGPGYIVGSRRVKVPSIRSILYSTTW